MTNDGNIVVDGVLASCYAQSDHDLAHIAMTPAQLFPEIMEWIFGRDAGFSVFTSMMRELGNVMLPLEQYYS